MSRYFLPLAAVILWQAAIPPRCHAQVEGAPQAEEIRVAAKVKAEGAPQAEEIHVADVRRKLKETFVSLERIRKDALPRFQALALGQLVDQMLVLQSLERDKLGASREEVDAEFAVMKKTVTMTEPFAEHLKKYGFTEASRHRALAWEMSWNRHSGRTATQEAKEAFFKEHRRELDGTELRVAHILFKPADPAVPADIDALVKTAAKVRQAIIDGKTTFEDAVVAHSGGTKRGGGDLGFIQRQKSMPEPFARAAFELAKGQISPPVVTNFGVHLIRCTDERRGELALENDDVQDAVKLRLRQQLFEEIAGRERKKALADSKSPGIHFTGHSPYFKPGTAELVLPTAP